MLTSEQNQAVVVFVSVSIPHLENDSEIRAVTVSAIITKQLQIAGALLSCADHSTNQDRNNGQNKRQASLYFI